MTPDVMLSRRVARAVQYPPLSEMPFRQRRPVMDRVVAAENWEDLREEDKALIVASESSAEARGQ